MATGKNIRTYFDGSWHEGDIAVMKAADHGMWLGSNVFDGARLANGLTPDLDKHCARVNASAAALMVTYTLYTLLPGALLALEVPESRAGEPGMIWTIPFVAYGVLRYLYLVYRQEQGERPEKLLTGDIPLFLSVAGYGAVVAWVVYL